MKKNKKFLGAFSGCLIGIILARVITRYFGNDMPEHIDFFITAFFPSIGLVLGNYVQKKQKSKSDSK